MRIVEIFTLVSALAGIATFLGVRVAWRRSKDAAKRGFDIIHMDRAECPICYEKMPDDEIAVHLLEEHPEELKRVEEQWKLDSQNSSNRSLMPSSHSER